MIENWADIPNWFGLYQISDLGRVRSLGRLKRILKPHKLKNGYLTVGLCRGLKRRTFYVHFLVLGSFSGLKPKGLECCHNNGVRQDNKLRNLRYDTRSSNALDRWKHGTMTPKRGEDHYQAKLTKRAVDFIRKNYKNYTQRRLAKIFKVSHSAIGAVIRKESWVGE